MNLETLFRLDGRTAVVIGAGSGIGQAAARGLAAHGAFVYCADVNLELAEATARELPQGAALAADVTNAASIQHAFDQALSERGRLDVVVSTPAVNVRKPLLNYTEEEFERVINVNLKGTFLVLREAGQRMAAQGSGSIIAISSIRSLTVEPDRKSVV